MRTIVETWDDMNSPWRLGISTCVLRIGLLGQNILMHNVSASVRCQRFQRVRRGFDRPLIGPASRTCSGTAKKSTQRFR